MEEIPMGRYSCSKKQTNKQSLAENFPDLRVAVSYLGILYRRARPEEHVSKILFILSRGTRRSVPFSSTWLEIQSTALSPGRVRIEPKTPASETLADGCQGENFSLAAIPPPSCIWQVHKAHFKRGWMLCSGTWSYSEYVDQKKKKKRKERKRKKRN